MARPARQSQAAVVPVPAPPRRRAASAGARVGSLDDGPVEAEPLPAWSGLGELPFASRDPSPPGTLNDAARDALRADVVEAGPARLHFDDADPAQRDATRQAVQRLSSQLAITRPIDVHLDDEADRALAGRASRGAARADRVFIRPRGFDATSRAGRALLAHELAHVAQSAPLEPGDAAAAAGGVTAAAWAEHEAHAIGEAFAEGRTVSAPRHALPAAAVAHDDGDRAREDEILKTPKVFTFNVSYRGIEFVPKPASQRWEGNIDRRAQTFAAQIKALVGTAYTVALYHECRDWLEANGGIEWINIPARPARQDDTFETVYMGTRLANNVVGYFTNVRKPAVPLLLSPRQIGMLRELDDLATVYKRLQAHELIYYKWYTQDIFLRVMFENRTIADELIAAGADENKLVAAVIHRDDALFNYERAMDAIRGDAALVNEPGYRGLWRMPAASPDEVGKPGIPVEEDSEVDSFLGASLLLDMQAHHDKKEIDRAFLEAKFRKAVFADWARRMQLRKIDIDGDIALRDAPEKAVQGPDPASMFSHPPLEAPYYDRQAGTEMLFWMNVYTPNAWEHFIPWHYAWEVVKIPDNDWNQRDATGQDLTRHGEDVGGFGSILGSRMRRNLSNAEVDVGRSLDHIENVLGPVGTTRVGLQATSSALSMLGSVIKTSFGKFTERPWEYNPAIKDPGMYVVRCTATRPENKDTLIHKMPSSAYLPIWVRPAADIVTDRVKVDQVMADLGRDRLAAIDARLKDKENPPTDEERKALEKEQRGLLIGLHGDAKDQLNLELEGLEDRIDPTKHPEPLDPKERAEIDKRIAEIKAIRMKRGDWLKDLGDDARGAPQKLIAYFITQEGATANRPMKLLLEVVPLKADKGKFRFAALDSTTKDSEHREGPNQDTRSDAIVGAIRTLLEDVGYGRGTVTVAIPRTIWDVDAKTDEVRTIDIARSEKQLFFEGLENAALVASIVLIAAAPFTDGASLVLLVPVGVVGAIPSAYRIAHRVSEGTFEWDMATAMDLLNCLGAAAGLGQFATSMKLIQVSAKVWTIVGLGMDGLQAIAGTYDLISKLSQIDPTLPEGARMAQAMEIVGNSLLQLGIAIGGRMAAEGAARKAALESGAGIEASRNVTRAPIEKLQPLLDVGIKDVPVLLDASLKGPEAHVVFTKDGYGMPSEVKIVASPSAPVDMIRLHVETVQLLQKYSGLFGWMRSLWDRVNAIRQSKVYVKPGSRGFNALAEIAKIKGIIEFYSGEIRDGKVSRIDGEAYLDYLEQEVRRHEQAVNEIEQGAGFIAAQAPQGVDAVRHGYPEAPPGHYYVQESPGQFQLRAHVGYDGPPKMVVEKKGGKGGWEIVDRPPEKGVQQPGTPGAKADPALAKLDPAQLQADVSKALKITSSELKIVPTTDAEVRVVPPAETGGAYELRLPAGATSGAVERAVGRHNDLRAMRPSDLTKIPLDPSGKPKWNGALEAEYRGRPVEEGYHWRLQDGKLQYVAEATEEGVAARRKRVWDEKQGKLVDDPGPVAKAWPAAPPPTTKAMAFDDLGGNNPTAPFGRWVALMESLGFKRADLVDALQEPSGLNYDTVRHNLKKQPVYQNAIKAWLTDPAQVRKRYPAMFEGIPPGDQAAQDKAVKKAQHQAVLDVDKFLALKDATVWTEKWYVELFGKAGVAPGTKATVETQVLFDKTRLNNANIDVAETRQPDVVVTTETPNPKDASKPVKKTVVKDVKSHEGVLSPDDTAQFADYKKTIGKDVPRADGDPIHVDALVEVFLDPRGGKANAEWMAGELSKAGASLSFEVFNQSGEPRTFGQAEFNRAGSSRILAAAIIAYCDT
jgi:hypothetical protein